MIKTKPPGDLSSLPYCMNWQDIYHRYTISMYRHTCGYKLYAVCSVNSVFEWYCMATTVPMNMAQIKRATRGGGGGGGGAQRLELQTVRHHWSFMDPHQNCLLLDMVMLVARHAISLSYCQRLIDIKARISNYKRSFPRGIISRLHSNVHSGSKLGHGCMYKCTENYGRNYLYIQISNLV